MYIYGKNVAKEALTNKEKIEKIFLYDNFNDKEILSLISDFQINYLSKQEMDRKVDGNHQGIILKVKDYEYATLENIVKDNGLIVILDHLEDPHNFGAIIRTCEAAGVDGIIIPKDRSVSVNGTVSKVSAGTLEKMKIVMVINLVNTIKELKNNGYWITGTDMDGTNYYDIDYKGKIVIIIGNEGSGISRLVKENCDFIASIPMNGDVNSLNASVATGIVIFEAVKQRGKYEL